MAYDKIVDSTRLDAALKSTADAIRAKTGGMAEIAWDADTGFASEVEGISVGVSGNSPYYEVSQTISIRAVTNVICIEPTYYRLTITDFRRRGTQGTYASVAELTLYDADGNNIAAYDGSQLYSANSYTTSSESPASAFDGDVSTFWHSVHSGDTASTTNWLQVGLSNPPEIVSFGITPRKDYGFDVPYRFYLSVSDDGTTWNVVDAYTATDGWALGEERKFDIVSQNAIMLYNGVQLPKIPADALASYPYALILHVLSQKKYYLVFSDAPYYYDSSITVLITNSNTVANYNLFTADAGMETGWTFDKNANYRHTLSDTIKLVWSNYDIPNGSATATEIYFEGSDPILSE